MGYGRFQRSHGGFCVCYVQTSRWLSGTRSQECWRRGRCGAGMEKASQVEAPLLTSVAAKPMSTSSQASWDLHPPPPCAHRACGAMIKDQVARPRVVVTP
ncbi:hypothetical protein BC628DRAFT_1391136 [Trametes gibbosa]|nr:hypothetical protein BC628DRAFT_1391136 [Trametes gibbosa]